MMTKKIMILKPQDNPPCYLKNLLRRYGFQMVEEYVRENILEIVLKDMPQIILMNTFSNDYHTIEIIDILKKNKLTEAIPIMVNLHQYSPEAKEKLIQSGIDDYIEYPFLESELLLKINNLLKQVELNKNLKDCKKALEESILLVQGQKQELEKNLSMAAKIQEALIPKTLGNIPNCSFVWHFQPSGRVGGDIFDVFMLNEDHMGLYVIDVMGHGLASSMLAVALSESLILDVERGCPLKRKINDPPYYEIISPKEVIHYLNKRFPFEKYGHYFTIVYMILNVKTGVLKYVRGGHPCPLLVKSHGEIIELDGYGTPIGFELGEDYEEKTVYLDSGDTIIAYTDGVLELKDEEGNYIDYDGFINHLKNEISIENHHYTLNLKKLSRNQLMLKDDLSFIEMKWIKFV